MSDIPKKLTLYFDGLCEPKNPGGYACYGWLIRSADDDAVIKTGHGCAWAPGHEYATNNMAEYAALGFALKFLADAGWKGELAVYGDSQLVVRQLTGEYACNVEKLQKIRERVLSLMKQVADPLSIVWVPREQNQSADALSKVAYEQITGEKCPERKPKDKVSK